MTDRAERLPDAEEGESGSSRWGGALLRLGYVALVIVLGALVVAVSQRTTTPGAASPEAGFAHDMIVHHAQAVDMATVMYDKTQDATLKTLALDIMLTQENQIGQMEGWLQLWGLPIASADPAMAWMDMAVTSGLMPGMATPEQLDQLRAAEGTDAERLFLQLMINHHTGGIHMGEGILSRTQNETVRTLANSMVTSQQREIELMQGMLAQLPG